MQINREDVVQAALTVERWCAEHCSHSTCYDDFKPCDCPFVIAGFSRGCVAGVPKNWNLEEHLRTRGLKK